MFQCFKEGTLVKTKDGKKAIEEIKEGDYVYAYDEVKKEYAYKKVISLSRNVTKKWCYVSLIINGKKETIVSTPGHKYYVPCNDSNRDNNEILEHTSYKDLSNKWVSAYLLRSGDKVLLSSGSYGIIDSVIVEDLINDEVTYNFEVEDYHTYFVGDGAVCVHNAGCNKYYEMNLEGDEYVKGREITKKQAIKRIQNDESVWVNSRKGAKSLAKSVAAKGKPMAHINHDVGYYMHFHDANHVFSGHVFYGEPVF